MKQVLLLSLLVLSHFAFAVDGREGHGGITVFCNGQPPVLLDYFNASLPTIDGPRPDLLPIEGLSEEETIALFNAKLDKLGFNDFRLQIEEALKKVGPINTWIASDLKQMDDSNQPYNLPPGCEPRTAAIRQKYNIMYGDPTVIKALSPAQRGVLRWHEAVYWKVNNGSWGNPDESSEGVRVFMREFLKSVSTKENLANEIRRVYGDPFTWLDLMPLNGVLLEPINWSEGERTDAQLNIDHNYRLHVSIDFTNHRLRLNWYSGNKPVDSSINYSIAHKDLYDCRFEGHDHMELHCSVDRTTAPFPFGKESDTAVTMFFYFTSDKSMDLYFVPNSVPGYTCEYGNLKYAQFTSFFHGTSIWRIREKK